MRPAVSRDTFFRMEDNTVSDSDSSREVRADEGLINLFTKLKGWGQILLPPKKLK